MKQLQKLNFMVWCARKVSHNGQSFKQVCYQILKIILKIWYHTCFPLSPLSLTLRAHHNPQTISMYVQKLSIILFTDEKKTVRKRQSAITNAVLKLDTIVKMSWLFATNLSGNPHGFIFWRNVVKTTLRAVTFFQDVNARNGQ